MAKRKLSIQQQRRIDRRHRPVDSSSVLTGEERDGIVVTRFGKQADVMSLGISDQGAITRCHIRANVQDVVTGDSVKWLDESPTGVIVSVLPRKSLMSRPDNQGKPRGVAANVSQIAIVIAPEPYPHQNLVDRYLAAIEHLGIRPILVVNKIDLGKGDEHLASLVALYQDLGYAVYEVSVKQKINLAPLLSALVGESTVFVGQSGVGKSSLVNLICPAAEAAIGELSQVAKGRHTTTTATLYRLENGGYLIDSPGIREFGLWHLNASEIAAGFIEFRPFLGQCKFRNCRHINEPGCAVIDAVNQHQISTRRLESYQQIVQDLNQG